MIDIVNLLKSYQDPTYAKFTKKIVPDTGYQVIGVRVPKMREIAKELAKNVDDAINFIYSTHTFYEEYFTCALTIAYIKCNDNKKIELLKYFLPKIDNWAICDSLSSTLKCVRKNREIYFDFCQSCFSSDKTYTVRFGIVCFMDYFLDNEYIDKVLELVKKVNSTQYYINMAIAWLISFALIKHYKKTVTLLENKELSTFIHNKSIQKANESFRIDTQTKQYLSSLKIK